MKSAFAYYGGKAGMAAKIVQLLPPHRVYIEPFFGSGAVFFAKRPATHEVINDLDGAVVNFFRVLREQPDELEVACRLTPYAREEFDAAVDLDDDLDPVERARRFWVRVNQSFAKTAGTHTGWSVTTARTQAPPASVLSRIERFRSVAERLIGVSIENCDAVDLVTRMATDDAVVYCDPPYVHTTRAARLDRKNPKDYRFDMGSEDDHRRLAEVLCATKAAVLLSGYPGPLYEELYDGWWSIELNVTAHSSNAVNGGRTARVEKLWSNRPIHQATGLFDQEEAVQ